jgi:putative SOS response-associated peptidase YedK
MRLISRARTALRRKSTDLSRATGEDILSCTIITKAASKWMSAYHSRMPAVLEEKDFDAWLDGSGGPDVLKSAPHDFLREHLVSKRVNKTGVGDDDPTIIDPV